MYKTHTCGELRASHIGKTIELAGWVHRYRDHGGILFIDLRDRFGITQVVINPDLMKANPAIQEIRNEWVIQIKGLVNHRPQGAENAIYPPVRLRWNAKP